MAVACASPQPQPQPEAPKCEARAREASPAERDQAASLWSTLVSSSKAHALDAAEADRIAASSSALEPAVAASCGTGTTAQPLISSPFQCSDDCRPTWDDLANALGQPLLDRLAKLATNAELQAAIAAKDTLRILAIAGGLSEVAPYVEQLKKLNARSNACKAFKATSCGAPLPGGASAVSGTWRWQWHTHVPTGSGHTQTQTIAEIKVDFDLDVVSTDAAGVLSLEGPAKLDLVAHEGVMENSVVPSGQDCPVSWHITGDHVFTARAKGVYDAKTGKIYVSPGTFTFTEQLSFTDCMTGTQTGPADLQFAWEGCEGTVVNGVMDVQHENQHKPTGLLADITLVDKDVDQCHLVVR
jgi:hypothetical protein